MGSDTSDEKQVDRRSFMSWAIAGISAFIAAAVGIPMVGAAVMPALKASKANEVNAGPVASFPLGQAKSASLSITQSDGWVQSKQDRGIWVVRTADAEFTVFNGRCVHLGCAYSWDATRKAFFCPCHGGVYTLDGAVVAGPPPRSLDTLKWRVDQGNLMVEYEDYRLGIPQKEVA